MPQASLFSDNVPFDPVDVDIRLQHFTVADIINMVESGDMEIIEENDLQRLPDLWDIKRKSLLIESLMINLPLPMFYLDGSERPYRIIDGLQRISTLYQFISNSSEVRFSLKNLEYLRTYYNNFTYQDLPFYVQRNILKAPIEAFVINPGTAPEVKYSIFQRINTLGLKLNGQEVRNAVFRGRPFEYIKDLANEQVFKDATNHKVTVKRMIDREYATRFVAFYWYMSDYFSDIDKFLGLALQSIYEKDDLILEHTKGAFLKSMERALELLGPFAFYRFESNGAPRGRTPNKAIFDTLSFQLANLADHDYNKIYAHRNDFKNAYIRLQNDNLVFFKSINDTTSSTRAVRDRFSILNDFIQSFI